MKWTWYWHQMAIRYDKIQNKPSSYKIHKMYNYNNDGQIGLSDSSDLSDLLIFALTNRTNHEVDSNQLVIFSIHSASLGFAQWIESIRRANWANNTNKRINICPICTNRTNIYSFICIICTICPVNWWSIRLIRSRGRFDLHNLPDSLCKFSRFWHA